MAAGGGSRLLLMPTSFLFLLFLFVSAFVVLTMANDSRCEQSRLPPWRALLMDDMASLRCAEPTRAHGVVVEAHAVPWPLRHLALPIAALR
jgi:hypothetical protein